MELLKSRLLVISLLSMLIPACFPTVKVEPGADTSKYADFPNALKVFPGREELEIQKEIGSPNAIERKDADHIDWMYKYKFWEPGARLLYRSVTLHFENGKLKNIEAAR